jgi:hypothetical protein
MQPSIVTNATVRSSGLVHCHVKFWQYSSLIEWTSTCYGGSDGNNVHGVRSTWSHAALYLHTLTAAHTSRELVAPCIQLAAWNIGAPTRHTLRNVLQDYLQAPASYGRQGLYFNAVSPRSQTEIDLHASLLFAVLDVI